MKNRQKKEGRFDYLTTNLSRHHATNVRMRPFAFRPGIDVFEIVREIDGVQLTVNKLANVPRKIVVPAKVKSSIKCLGDKPKMLPKCPSI